MADMSYIYTVSLNANNEAAESSSPSPSSPVSREMLGGKGFNLTKLMDAAAAGGSGNGVTSTIHVPPGFCVTVRAYRDFLQRNQFLCPVITEALTSARSSGTSQNDNHDDGEIASESASAAALEEASTTIRTAFSKAKLSPELIDEIHCRMKELEETTTAAAITNGAPPAVAVRSSATAEDMPDLSFAGQQDTYLNVVGEKAICKAIVDCFSSLFTARAIGYRQRNDYNGGVMMMGIAVVVQAMVSPLDSSGVLFTANPLTGRRNESVVEVVPGLGEALVSGLVEPDMFVVGSSSSSSSNESCNNNGCCKILDRRLGSKAVCVRPAPQGQSGVVHVVRKQPEQQQGDNNNDGNDAADGTSSSVTFVLNDDAVRELVQIGRTIEQNVFDGVPQDIEFARSNGRNYIVQSRPITTLFPLPQDGVSSSSLEDDPLKVMVSFGAVQGVVAPITPAGQDMIRFIMGGASSLIYGKRGMYERTKGVLCVAAERLFINVAPLLRNSAGRKFVHNVFPEIEPGVAAGLKQLEDDPRLAVTGGISPRFVLRLLSLVPIVFPRLLYTLFFPDRSRQALFDGMEQCVAEVQIQCDKATDLQQALYVQESLVEHIFPFILPRVMPRMITAMGSIFRLLHLVESSSIPYGQHLVLTLTRGLPHNVTTEMDLQLWTVARQIQKDNESLDSFRKLNAEALAKSYLENRLPKNAQRAIQNFLGQYGMRGFAEIDFGRPRWREDPTPLMQTLKSYIGIPKDRAPDRVFQAGAQAAEEAAARLKQELGHSWLVDFYVRRIRALAGVRELPKFTMIRCMGIIRERLLKEGDCLVKSDVLDNRTDMFLLYRSELKALAAGKAGDWKGLVAARRARLNAESKRQRIPQLLATDGFAYFGACGATRLDGQDARNKNELYGVPVSPGTATGKVRVVLNPSQTRVMPGEILVCPGTDPSWTPLFLSVSALVMEVGGLMTHGSVVAREYGIPAVVGVEHVTEKLKTGQTVVVDGSTGVVKLVDETIG